MERSQLWTFIVVGIACGICFEVLKGPRTPSVRLSGFTRFETLLEEGRPVYNPEAESHAKPAKTRPVAGKEALETADPVQVAEFKTPGPTVAAAATAKPDDKKKAEDKKKKKKKKKKRDDQEPQNAETPEDDSEKSDDSGDAAIAAENTPPAAPLAAAPAARKGIPETAEEWIAYLFEEPTFERISKFIKLKQTGQVKNEVYFQVIKAMLADSRRKVREYGLMSLAAIPGQRSFVMLDDVARGDRDQILRGQAESYKRMYARVENLRHLSALLSAGVSAGEVNPLTQYEAIRLIRMSAEANLKPKEPVEQGTGVEPRTVGPETLRSFTALLEVLDQTSKRNANTDVRMAAAETIADLEVLLSTTTASTSNQQPTT